MNNFKEGDKVVFMERNLLKKPVDDWVSTAGLKEGDIVTIYASSIKGLSYIKGRILVNTAISSYSSYWRYPEWFEFPLTDEEITALDE